MRPLKIKMQNFGPYADETIDFTKFTESQLFLISGQTGAGKTTMFDAMTYALFGDVIDRKGTEMRSEFATPDDATAVTFWFEHHGKYYRVKRQPTYLRRSVRSKDPTKLVDAKATVEMAEVAADLTHETKALGTKKNIVDRLITELLHLTAEQFRQIIILPQGEFRKFLSAPSDVKADTLRSLFGTEIFDTFTQQLKESNSAQAKAIEKLTDQVEGQFTNLSWPTDTVEPVAGVLSERLAQAQQVKVAEQSRLAGLQKEAEVAEQQQTEAAQAYSMAVTLSAQFDRYQELITREASLLADEPRIAQQRQRQKWLNEALSYQSQVLSYQSLQKQAQALTAKLTELIAERTQVLQEAAAQAKRQAQLTNTQTKVTDARERRRQILEELKPLAARVTDLEGQIDKTEHQLQTDTNQLASVQADFGTQETQVQSLRDQLDQLADLKEVERQQHDLDLQYAGLEAQQATIMQTEQEQQTQRAKLNELQARAEQLTTQNEATQSAAQEAKRQRARIMIAMLQADLVVGEPCAICGEIFTGQHNDVHLQNLDQTDLHQQMDAVDAAEQRAQEALTALTQVHTEMTGVQQALDKLAVTIGESQQALADAYADFLVTAAAFATTMTWPAAFEAAQVTANVMTLRDRLKTNQTRYEALTAAKATAQSQLNQTTATIAQIEQRLTTGRVSREEQQHQLAQLTAGQTVLSMPAYDAEVQQLNGVISTFEEAQTVLAKAQQKTAIAIERIETQLKLVQQQQAEVASQITAHEEDFTGVFTKFSVTNLTDFIELLQQPGLADEARDLQREITTYEANVQAVHEQLTQLNAQLADQSRPDLEALRKVQTDAEMRYKQSHERYMIIRTTVTNFAHQVDAIATQIRAIEQKNAAGKALNELVVVMTGRGRIKLNLERYVLRQFMLEVLHCANANYINTLSNGRYQFTLDDTQHGVQNQNGLEINVIDYAAGGVQRSTTTLSGGESFMAALAIALSLAEVVQNRAGGAKIEALFIDEGFGSLDNSTLAQAIEALRSVEAGGRLVGVISHVDAMKREIQQQLLVKKHGDGHSSIAYSLV